MTATVRITEVGPRDGLQNEPHTVAAADKVRFIDLLSAAGFAEVEATSFVSPKRVPQLADADLVLAAAARRPGVLLSALVPNEQGLARALAAGVGKVSIFLAASETFSQRNGGATIAESLARAAPVVTGAKAAGLPVRGYLSCAVACPFEGPIAPHAVADVAARLLDLGIDELDLGDTIGVAVPADIERLYAALTIAPAATTLHLHDTRGTALACAVRALGLGVRSFDASCLGLGGCPFAPGAAGNLATEDLVYLCQRSGLECGVDLDRLFAAGRFIADLVGHPPAGRVFTADGRGG